MLTRDHLLRTLRSHRDHLAAEYGVRRIGLFGSFATGEADEASDVDLVAELERPLGLKFIELVSHLESLFGREVDLLTPAGIEAIRNPELIREIRGSLIYA